MNKFQFIRNDLLVKIQQQVFIEKLPTQRELSKNYNVSRQTIQRVLRDLVEIGIVKSVQGAGTFIDEDRLEKPLLFNSLTKIPYERIQSKVISFSKINPSNEDYHTFELANQVEKRIWQFKRVRIVDYEIQQIEDTKLPVYLFPKLTEKVVQQSLQEYVLSLGFKISKQVTTYETFSLTSAEARLLNCKRSQAAIKILNKGILMSGRVFEQSQIISINYSATYMTNFDEKNHLIRLLN